MNILDGIQNFLQILNENWTTIIVIIALIASIAKKIKDYFGKTDAEKTEIVKAQIKETMLKLITDAELDYEEWIEAGEIKRAQVLDKVFEKYPILSKIANQEDIIKWLDDVIDESLETMREIFTKNTDD